LRSQLRDWVDLARPLQWSKNSFVLAPLLFSQRLFDPEYTVRTAFGVAAFCLASSASYVVNDVHDRDSDRVHPLKRDRPVAASRIAPRAAVVYAAALIAGAALLAWPVGAAFGRLLGAYVALQLAYSFLFRRIPGLDAVAIAAGFVLRAAAGVVAAGALMSPWLLECTFGLALFLALGKRRHEALLLEANARAHRVALAGYDPAWLDGLLKGSALVTLLLYAAYAISPAVAEKLGTDGMWKTIPFVALGLLRYLFVIYHREDGGDPTGVLLGDTSMQLVISGWILTVFVLLYVR
jgi:4-hydroxybenzoate polyprenyltransferase